MEDLGRIGDIKLQVTLGNLLEVPDPGAIVVPVNTWLYLNGGIARQLARRVGVALELQARQYAPLPIGNAILLSPLNLGRPVILAPTVQQPVDSASADGVARATRAALRCADANEIADLLFPALGTGTGGVPYEECASEMMRETTAFLHESRSHLRRILWVAMSPLFANAIKRAYVSGGDAVG